MIVVLSYNGDAATTEIIDWLHAYGCNYKRVNLCEEDFRRISLDVCTGEKFKLQLELKDGSILDIDEVSVFLFRGGLFEYDVKIDRGGKIPYNLAKTYQKYEFETLTDFFYKEISKKCIGNLLLYPLNKLEQLKVAQKVGINVPNTFVGRSKKQLKNSCLKNESVFITKSIQENIFCQGKGRYYELNVNEININELEDEFSPSLFQESMGKFLEIRSFYLEGKFYSIAMLLCASNKRVIDFRNQTKDIRYTKYQLPCLLEKKLHQLMTILKLNTGSIDLLQTKDTREYFFLEVNPTGQFGWVSDYGNYYIEREIAIHLIEKEKKYENKKRKKNRACKL